MVNQDTYSGPSFSFQNRFARIIWMGFYLFLFRYTPNPFHSWRSFVLRLFGAKVGIGVHVYPKVKIWAPWNLELGDYSGVANDVNLYSQGKITIGKKAVISQGAHLCAGTHDYTHPGFPQISKPIHVGDQSWIAAEAFIHPGISIGEGAVIGARSVVNRDMPSWMVCSGHPCIPLKTRKLHSPPVESVHIFS